MKIERPMNSKKITKKLEKYQKKINNSQKNISEISKHFKKSKIEQKSYLSQLRNLFKRGYYSPNTLKFHQNRLSTYRNKLQSLSQSYAGGGRKSGGVRRHKLSIYF